jgi:hypothetical protein
LDPIQIFHFVENDYHHLRKTIMIKASFMVFIFLCILNFALPCLPATNAAADQSCPPWVQAHRTIRENFQKQMCSSLWDERHVIDEEHLPLMELALYPQHIPALARAIARGADLTKTTAGQIPLYAAVCNGNTLGALLLLEAGSPVDHQTYKGDTTLMCATTIKNYEVMQQLLLKNACIRRSNSQGRTPLHMAALTDYAEGACLLIAAGAPVNAQDHEGNTPLHLIARASCVTDESDDDEDCCGWTAFNPLVILLIARGADPDLKNAQGKSPCDLVDESYRAIWENSLKLGENQKQIYEAKLKARYYTIDQSIPAMPPKCTDLINAYAELPT